MWCRLHSRGKSLVSKSMINTWPGLRDVWKRLFLKDTVGLVREISTSNAKQAIYGEPVGRSIQW